MTRPLQYPAGDLSVMLADRIEAVVDALHIDVKHRTRRTLECFAPWDGHHKPKLIVELFPTPGKWNEWIGGKWGDALDLVACALGNGEKDRKAAYQWALEFLGLKRERDPEWDNRLAASRAAAAQRAVAAELQLGEARRRMFARWLRCQQLQPGDYGWTYLDRRGIPLGELPRPVRAIRLGVVEKWIDPHHADPDHFGPALCTAMTLGDGTFGSLHRTWIDPTRPGEKADLALPRKMFPDAMGAAMRLWRGASGLSVRDAVAKGIEEEGAVAEGVEDGLSVALMKPELRIDAAGSLGGLLAYTPSPTVKRLTICADNDWSNPQAQPLLDRACRRLVDEFGLEVAVARSPEGKDFNDLLRGA